LIDFLDAGKGVYIEGANFSSYNEGSPLYGKFGTKLAGVGNFWQTGNIETVFGETGSVVEGLDYDYLYQQPPDNLVDHIDANGGSIIFASQDGIGRGVMYAGVSNTYRTINTSFIFSALVNGIHTKNDLMEAYMDYLTGNTAVDEHENGIANALSLTVSPNPFSNTTVIRYQMRDASPKQVSMKVYDITGRLVRQLNNPTIQPSNQIVWDGTDNSGRRVSSGTYIVRIATDHDIVNRAVVLID